MRLKYAFFLSFFCVIILSCTDKKPVSQAQESSVQQKDGVPVKKVDSVKVAKTQPLTYKILVPFAYRFCNPDTLINKVCNRAKYPYIVITMESFIEFKVGI